MCSTTYAAQLGHARIVSRQNQPLRIAVPVTQLSQQDIQSFSVSAAPLADWRRAALIPPVDPATLHFQLVDGARPTSKTIQIDSSQPFNGPVADLLLNVQTATGRQQYQVSILAPVQQGGATAGSGGAGSQSPSANSAGSILQHGARTQAIRVRRGDTMFSLARRHAVPQVSVYQMMVGLQRANPQAFIRGNINLVRAGATLQVPGMAQLTAISDREARRIFQRQAQEFEQYRQGLAGRKGQAVTGGSAAEGRLSTRTPVAGADQNAPRAEDKVVLSSGSSADNSADERTATGENLADSRERVSQLEQNVKNLNLALQAQGQAAKDVVLDGATDLGQSISNAASSLSNNTAATVNGNAAGTAADARSAAAAGGSAVPGSAATPGSSLASVSATSSTGASDRPALSGGAAAPGAATASQPGNNGVNKGLDSSNSTVNNASNKAGQSVSWFQENLLGVVTALLALAVLIIAWVLRRANAARDDDDPASPITEAMVQEKLDKINLDLHEPPVARSK